MVGGKRKKSVICLSNIKLQDSFATCDLNKSLIHEKTEIKNLHVFSYKVTLLLTGKRKNAGNEGREEERTEEGKKRKKKKNKRKHFLYLRI